MHTPALRLRSGIVPQGTCWRGLAWVSMLLLVLSASACAWLDAQQRQLVYRPTPGGADMPALRPGDRRYFVELPSSVVNRVGESTGVTSQRDDMWWLPGSQPGAPTLLYFHGTVHNLTQNLEKMEALRAAGFAVLAVDYRGWGLSTAITPSERSILQDADVAWAELQRLEPRPAQRVIYGHSMGSGVAVDLASRLRGSADYGALILESAFTSFNAVAQDAAGWPGGLLARLLNGEHFDSLAKVGRVQAPLLLIHGSADATVSEQLGRALFEAAPEPKYWVSVPGGHHADLQRHAPAQYQAALRTFRLQHLGDRPARSGLQGSAAPIP